MWKIVRSGRVNNKHKVNVYYHDCATEFKKKNKLSKMIEYLGRGAEEKSKAYVQNSIQHSFNLLPICI